jgi:hypothetical protein
MAHVEADVLRMPCRFQTADKPKEVVDGRIDRPGCLDEGLEGSRNERERPAQEFGG